MKKLLSVVILVCITFLSHSQSGNSNLEITDHVTVPIEQQLATLFSRLNFTEAKTGLLEEHAFNPLDLEYLACGYSIL
ncbi:MAG: hypothetical protein H7259_03695, partial [Cytophagales bacterium]|nr:hypothetical protein [Cytophaga sp.]